MSDFLGLRIALSSLNAQRRALDVTGQNVANANTEGYTRQRVGMTSDAGPLTPAIHSRWNGSGMGVSVTGIDRFRDEFLELRANQEHATQAGLAESQAMLANIEMAFAEPGDAALAAQLADFWSGWDDVANRPDDVAARAQIIERASTLVSGFHQADSVLESLATGTAERLGATVAAVNGTAARIADLNKTIRSAVNNGLTPNDLLDQRGLLVEQLAEEVGATARPGEGGAIDVFIGGTAIVRGITTEPLKAMVVAPDDLRVVWARDDYPAPVGGAAGGMLGAAKDVIPRYRTGLSAVLERVVTEVNRVHETGVALDGTTGRTFFETGSDGRLAVNEAIVRNPKLIGAGAVDAGGRDGSIAQQLAAFADGVADPDDPNAVSPDAAYRELVVKLGVEAQGVNRRVSIQSAITRQVDDARESTAGVNLDEEMTNMIAYQHAYDASARFLTAIDAMLETLITRTGVVGR